MHIDKCKEIYRPSITGSAKPRLSTDDRSPECSETENPGRGFVEKIL